MRILEINTLHGPEKFGVASDFELLPDDLPENQDVWFLFSKEDGTRVAVRANHILTMNYWDEVPALLAAA